MLQTSTYRFSDEVARLWNSLADYYIRLGQFEKARDIYEEGINSVTTVRDFTIIFDEYIKVICFALLCFPFSFLRICPVFALLLVCL
jgi:pentatricopeptide repeat protein